MLLGVEFGKLFRRKFNYLFLIILVLINLAFVYKLDKLATYYDMSILNIIFNIIFRINLVLVVFVMGINYIFSYREDYISKVNVLLEIRKKKTVRDIFSILANLIYFLVYYAIVMSCFIGIIFLRKKNIFEELKTLAQNVNTTGAYAVMLVLLLLFANLIFLLALTLFNNTNLAISFSLLYFIGGEVIANMIKSRFSVPAERVDNSVLTIFTKSFNLLNQNITFSLGNFLPLVLNMLGLIVVIVIVRLMKKIIG
jgi:putative iron ABC transporter, permease protein